MRNICQFSAATITALFWLLLSSATVAAHAPTNIPGAGFESGFVHPVLGLDHLVAMFAVGLWGAVIGGASIWVLPAVFPVVMAVGAAAGIAGLDLPYAEIIIAVSAVIMGLAIAARWSAGTVVGAMIVGAFAIAHGFAHGAEMPQTANPLAYSLGFIVATGLIHVAGIAFGLLVTKPLNGSLARATGAVISALGVYFLVA